jgi:hypothetical protein
MKSLSFIKSCEGKPSPYKFEMALHLTTWQRNILIKNDLLKT